MQLAKSNPNLPATAASAMAAYMAARGLAPVQSNLPVAASGLAILADCSGSMRVCGKNGTRYDMMVDALNDIWPTLKGAALYGFALATARAAMPAGLQAPFGGTDLAKAIQAITPTRPTSVLVISDGTPTPENKQDSLRLAKAMGVPFSILFIGDPADREAIAFMRRLAGLTGGQCQTKDLTKLALPLSQTIKGLLPG